LPMYQAKLSLSPTPVTRATLPDRSIGIMVGASGRDGVSREPEAGAGPGTVVALASGSRLNGKPLAVYPPRRVRATRHRPTRRHTTTSPPASASSGVSFDSSSHGRSPQVITSRLP